MWSWKRMQYIPWTVFRTNTSIIKETWFKDTFDDYTIANFKTPQAYLQETNLDDESSVAGAGWTQKISRAISDPVNRPEKDGDIEQHYRVL